MEKYYRSKHNGQLYCNVHMRPGMQPVTENVYPEGCCRCQAQLAKLRDRYRNTVCSGCYNNRYNFPSSGDRRNAPTSGEGCWSLVRIRNGHCGGRRNF